MKNNKVETIMIEEKCTEYICSPLTGCGSNSSECEYYRADIILQEELNERRAKILRKQQEKEKKAEKIKFIFKDYYNKNFADTNKLKSKKTIKNK